MVENSFIQFWFGFLGIYFLFFSEPVINVGITHKHKPRSWYTLHMYVTHTVRRTVLWGRRKGRSLYVVHIILNIIPDNKQGINNNNNNIIERVVIFTSFFFNMYIRAH